MFSFLKYEYLIRNRGLAIDEEVKNFLINYVLEEKDVYYHMKSEGVDIFRNIVDIDTLIISVLENI